VNSEYPYMPGALPLLSAVQYVGHSGCHDCSLCRPLETD
jgi:hypothetical protein